MVEQENPISTKDNILHGLGIIDKATVALGGVFAIIGVIPVATFLVLSGGLGLAAEEYLKD